ncbi:MAG TPA: hypothetical protein P5169_05375 [Kiritimatiellia bacterium]|nr:hypothetical protein [Kiritimatiellia bacterium]
MRTQMNDAVAEPRTRTGSSVGAEPMFGMSDEELGALLRPVSMSRLVLADAHLAKLVKGLVDLAEEGEFAAARGFAREIEHRVRVLDLTSREDVAGVVRR